MLPVLFTYATLVVSLSVEKPVDAYQIIYQRHAVERMAQRGIHEEDVEHVLLTGETIEIYPVDTPHPSELLLGWRDARPLHVVATDTASQRKIVITVYVPASNKWESDFKRRKS
ncbi:MAG: hypothetical protein NVSMB49_19300 [Ktedonobacteraceae bacterium]